MRRARRSSGRAASSGSARPAPGPGRPAARLHHDRLVARVRDRGEALQLPGPERAGGNLLVPEVASRFTVSNGGRTYTFFIRKGFRFSDGTPVTARNFKYAIDRVANHDLASPGAAFITDRRTGRTSSGRRMCNDGTRERRQWRQRQGQPADHPPDPARRRVPVQDHDAVLPGDLEEAAARPRDRAHRRHHDDSVGGALCLLAERREPADVDQAEPVLEAWAGPRCGRATSQGSTCSGI